MKKTQNNQKVVFSPASKAQEQFLNSEAKFTFYGGAAGAGKSACLLGAFLKVCHHPNTRGVIFRRTTKQISNPGGLFDAAIRLYKQVDPKLKIRTRDLELEFSTGATLKFAYLDKPIDRYNFQGAELTFIGFDEIQQLDEENVVYLISRLRSTTVDYPLQIYATGNPDYDAFIRPWVEYALDQKGIPIRKESYPSRYFIRINDGYEWADTQEELEAKYGKADDAGIISFKFIPGNIYDNPILIKTNPGYLAQLKALSPVERDRLLFGSWYARAEAAGYFKRDWVTLVDRPNLQTRNRVRSWDIAMSLPSPAYPDPDWTRGLLVSKDKSSVYTVEDLVSIRDRTNKVEELIFKTAFADGKDVIITIPQDPGASAGAYAKGLKMKLAEYGFNCRLVRPQTSKASRFALFSSVSEAGFVNVVKADWNNEFFTELESFDGEKTKGHDDIVDTCSDATLVLSKNTQLPSFSLPSDLTVGNNFGFQDNQIVENLSLSTVEF